MVLTFVAVTDPNDDSGPRRGDPPRRVRAVGRWLRGISGGGVVEDQLRADGSFFVRDTFFVFEGGEWNHRFSKDEYDLLMPGVPFEEFVEAKQ